MGARRGRIQIRPAWLVMGKPVLWIFMQADGAMDFDRQLAGMYSAVKDALWWFLCYSLPSDSETLTP